MGSANVEQLITDHIDLWTSAIEKKSSSGRGSSKKQSLYGIKKLRELILELAVRGKLVPQDPSDVPASVLLERIAEERDRLVKEKKIKKPKKLAEIEPEEIPFELPQSWEWVRLGQVTQTSTGYAFKSGEYQEEGTFVLRVTNIETNGTINKDDPKYIAPELAEGKYSQFSLSEGEVLLVMVGGSLGKIGVVPQSVLPAILNQNMWRLFVSDFLNRGYFINGLKYINANQLEVTNSTHGHLSQGDYMGKLFPLPPQEEQNRIVAKVDELMALCDQLEAQTENNIEAHQVLVETLLGTLTQSQNAEELAENWERVAEHFDTLFTTEHSIDQLKQTILQLAVMGKLVPQDPSDEPVASLLEAVAAKKEQLIKDKLIKKQKPLPPISEAEIPFSLPDSWQWCRMDDICFGITSGSTPAKSEFQDDPGVPYLKVYNIRDQRIDLEYKPQFINRDCHREKLTRSILFPGDVVMNIVGPPLGKIAIIPETYPEWNCNQAIVFFRPIRKQFNHYLYTYLRAGIFLDYIELIGTAGQDNISVTKSRSIVIPLPPIAEQQRIVEKVEQLLNYCDSLRDKLNLLQQTQTCLANTIINSKV